MTDDAPVSRRERERERHRDEILGAAGALLLEGGIEAVTMEEIAKRSQFAVGTLYRFFGSKEDLVEAMIATHTESHAASVKELAAAAGDFEVLFDRFLDRHATVVERNIPLIQFMFSGNRPLMPRCADATSPLRLAAGQFVQALAGLLARGVREGVLGGEDPAAMALVLLSLLDGLSRSAWLLGRSDVHTILPVVRRAFLDGHRRR